jgi:hypothetical protein
MLYLQDLGRRADQLPVAWMVIMDQGVLHLAFLKGLGHMGGVY